MEGGGQGERWGLTPISDTLETRFLSLRGQAAFKNSKPRNRAKDRVVRNDKTTLESPREGFPA